MRDIPLVRDAEEPMAPGGNFNFNDDGADFLVMNPQVINGHYVY